MPAAALSRKGLRTLWCAAPVDDFDDFAPYRGLVAVTCELNEKSWLAQELPRAHQHTWLQIWRACEELYLRAGASGPPGIVSVDHRPRERVLLVAFGPASQV